LLEQLHAKKEQQHFEQALLEQHQTAATFPEHACSCHQQNALRLVQLFGQSTANALM